MIFKMIFLELWDYGGFFFFFFLKFILLLHFPI